MKNNFRKAALSTICMLIVAVMSLTGVTYAWFTAGTTATVNGMQMQVSAADGGVQVSALTDSGWTNYAATVDLNTTLEEVKPVSSVDGLSSGTSQSNPFCISSRSFWKLSKDTCGCFVRVWYHLRIRSTF